LYIRNITKQNNCAKIKNGNVYAQNYKTKILHTFVEQQYIYTQIPNQKYLTQLINKSTEQNYDTNIMNTII